eukprot:13713207-Alexandrium_andersonii.AAC.1
MAPRRPPPVLLSSLHLSYFLRVRRRVTARRPFRSMGRPSYASARAQPITPEGPLLWQTQEPKSAPRLGALVRCVGLRLRPSPHVLARGRLLLSA